MRIDMVGRLGNSSRGFTLIEIAVVLVVLGIAGMTTVPYFYGMRQRSQIRACALQLEGALERARTLARTGRTGFEGWAPDKRPRRAGLRIISPFAYEVFVDANRRADGLGELSVQSVNLAPPCELGASSSPEVRFKKNGTLQGASSFDAEVLGPDAAVAFRVEVNYGGAIRLTR